ncbi:hypothetical protein [Paucibacter soli]|uniref:hypothetical protein n=1 Tax=Paucibacter soli TaxID=3133433 RepID=UPI0030A15D46
MRALNEGSVPVLMLESDLLLPGVRTRLAELVPIEDINGPALVEALLNLRQHIRCPGNPVLFLTNDTMVRTVGHGWGRLAGSYALSWGAAAERLLPLLDKVALEAHCDRVGVAYPNTLVLRNAAEAEAAARAIGFPIIVKPSRPLSRFKTALPQSVGELLGLFERFPSDLPFLVQRFIPGDDRSIHFCALYLDRGQVLARFDGHKLRSRPMGHTSIAEALVDQAVYEQTLRFFAPLQLSGPVSLELKRDQAGALWVIEPTVGRTDFWIGLCTVNGVNIPLLEYCHQAGRSMPDLRQRDVAVWFNEDRDPIGRLWLGWILRLMRGRRASYLFLHRDDPGPSLAFLKEFLREFGTAVWRGLGKRLGRLRA